MSLLERLRRHDTVRAVDLALADTLMRLDPDADEHVPAAAALASLAVGLGHAAFDPVRPQRLLPAFEAWPDADAWLEALRASRLVAQPQATDIADASRPLVLENGLLYLRRYREYERRLAKGLHRIAAAAPAAGEPGSEVIAFVGAASAASSFDRGPDASEKDSRLTPLLQEDGVKSGHPRGHEPLAPLFTALFPQTQTGDDGQARAAMLALSRSLLLITGGPGTGKTTTIARVLLLLLAQAKQSGFGTPDPARGHAKTRNPAVLRIALAAPTGRAADRMAESLHSSAAQLRALPGIDPALIDALPTDASTLHRLLGTIPDSPRFRFDADTPLPFDVVVVDEASMVDLPLMCKLVEAVPAGARLILLGDRDQLPSVEAGDVLAAIGDAMDEGTNDDGREARARATLVASSFDDGAEAFGKRSRPTPLLRNTSSALAGHRAHLTRNYRQSAALDLAPLAEAVRAGDANRALELLRAGSLAGVHFHEELVDPLRGATREALLAPWRALADCSDPREALRLAAASRLLTALREGPQGARQLNVRIEEVLAGAQRAPYFHGRLLLVAQNSDRHGLFNGDIGVCLRGDDGATVAWFAGGSDGVRGFHPAALPAHAGAFAMTVHKAQGSECDAVWLLLPRQDARTLSRELVYTALTRARGTVHICAGESALRAALGRRVERISGLRSRL